MKVRDVMTSAVIAEPATALTIPGAGTSGIWRTPDRCPGCAGEHLYTVYDGESANFLCRSCNRCWNLAMGWMRQVDPETCPGCEWRSTCTSRWD